MALVVIIVSLLAFDSAAGYSGVFPEAFGRRCLSVPKMNSLHDTNGPPKNLVDLAMSVQTSFPFTSSEDQSALNDAVVKSFEYNGWNLTYKYKAASRGYEKERALLLVHPVGIGLSSWFWDKFMNAWQGPELVAIDLIGCGIQHGADAWDPNKRGLSIPLDWVKACEALMQIVASEKMSLAPSFKSSFSPFPILGVRKFGDEESILLGQYSVVVQGGLAPVGIVLASRNPELVDKLILTSPPAYNDLVTPITEQKLGENYNFFKSPIPGGILFHLLETRWAVRFFSNLFLFANPCDETWLDQVVAEACVSARPPVQVFNAGFCFHRSYEEEMESLKQPILVLQGTEDVERIPKRLDYAKAVSKCTLQILKGKNVLPWESADETVKAVKAFLSD